MAGNGIPNKAQAARGKHHRGKSKTYFSIGKRILN